MAGRITLTMIKPGAVMKGHTGAILKMINETGFRISALTMTKLSRQQAETFYAIHRSKAFYESLVEFMSSGPIVAAILERDNAVDDYRVLIGATDPSRAEDGTIRKMYAESVERNAVHGSDSDETAEFEADFFFAKKNRF